MKTTVMMTVWDDKGELTDAIETRVSYRPARGGFQYRIRHLIAFVRNEWPDRVRKFEVIKEAAMTDQDKQDPSPRFKFQEIPTPKFRYQKHFVNNETFYDVFMPDPDGRRLGCVWQEGSLWAYDASGVPMYMTRGAAARGLWIRRFDPYNAVGGQS